MHDSDSSGLIIYRSNIIPVFRGKGKTGVERHDQAAKRPESISRNR